MPTLPVPAPLRSLPPDALLSDLLAVSMTGVIYYTPLYDPSGSGEIVDFRFEYLNPTAQRMMHMPEVPTLTHNEQWPQSKAHGTFDFHVDAYVSGEPREYNINYQADGYDNYYRLAARRSGDGMWVSFTDTADQPRSPVEVALRDAQAREKTARAEAEAQRQRLHHILMELPASVATFQGPAHVYTLVSPGYQQLFPAHRLLGVPIREALPALAGQPFLDHLDQVYRTGEPYYGTEEEYLLDYAGTNTPQRRYFNIFLQALRAADGAVNGILNFSYDVTEQVEARRQLERLNQELEARVQERTQALHASNQQLQRTNVDLDNFIYTASHDLRVPITNIEGLVHALQAHLPLTIQASPEVGPVLAMMEQSVERFQRTLAYLSDVVKLQEEDGQAVAEVALQPVLDDVYQDLLPLLTEHGVQLSVDVDPGSTVVFSPKNLRSVVYNLLSNAVKYRHPDRVPAVRISCHEADGYTVLTVTDEGVGIPAHRHAELFQLFRRLHSHTQGSGIGLYMVKRMVDNAGGRIEVESDTDRGASFRVYFPR
ncbi:hypothetical protein GCM10027346_41990 [Hymenobacter seoulensis]